MILVFAIDSMEGLENAPEEWTPEVNHSCTKIVPKILVGIKKDLRGVAAEGKTNCDVSCEKGWLIAQRLHAYLYIELE